MAELALALDSLVSELENSKKYLHFVADYKAAKSLANHYFEVGFTQGDLNELTETIPDFSERHKEWVPPLEEGYESVFPYRVATWFTRIDQKYKKVCEVCERVRAIGEY